MRSDVKFKTNDGINLAGWLYLPDDGGENFPLVVLTQGFSALKEMGLDDTAKVFEAAGLACLAYDHRNLGQSEGEPRREINPWQQIEDIRCAISFACTLTKIDPERIGLWGASYAGAHALVVAATDKRVKCVVSQVPFLDGVEGYRRAVNPHKLPEFWQEVSRDHQARLRGEPPRYIPVAEESMADESYNWLMTASNGTYENSVTLQSYYWYSTYRAKDYIDLIAPTPLLMIVGERDLLSLTDVQLAAFNRAAEPKKLVVIKNAGHYDPYIQNFDQASGAARDWFAEHLRAKADEKLASASTARV